jgi:dethiobiotin synthetase
MHRIVLLGTGTAVGKTYVAACLARALHQRFPQSPVLALKPLETGCPHCGSHPAPGTDAAALEHATFNAPPPRPHPLHAFPDPLSPHLAAARSSALLATSTITRWVEQAESHAKQHYTTSHVLPWTVVETAGGAFTPLAPNVTNVTLAQALDPAHWILVAPDCLGVIHDVTATLLAMQHTARRPDCVALTAARPPDTSTSTNARELRALGVTDVAAVFGRNDPNPARALLDLLLPP